MGQFLINIRSGSYEEDDSRFLADVLDAEDNIIISQLHLTSQKLRYALSIWKATLSAKSSGLPISVYDCGYWTHWLETFGLNIALTSAPAPSQQHYSFPNSSGCFHDTTLSSIGLSMEPSQKLSMETIWKRVISK